MPAAASVLARMAGLLAGAGAGAGARTRAGAAGGARRLVGTRAYPNTASAGRAQQAAGPPPPVDWSDFPEAVPVSAARAFAAASAPPPPVAAPLPATQNGLTNEQRADQLRKKAARYASKVLDVPPAVPTTPRRDAVRVRPPGYQPAAAAAAAAPRPPAPTPPPPKHARAQSPAPPPAPPPTPTPTPRTDDLSVEETAQLALKDTFVVSDRAEECATTARQAAERARDLLLRHAETHPDHAHAIDTEVQSIDVKNESACGHGRVICISIYAGPLVDFKNDKIYDRISDVPDDAQSTLWLDTGVYRGLSAEDDDDDWMAKEARANAQEDAAVSGKNPNTRQMPELFEANDVLRVFRPYLEDPNVHKVWHNYGFDRHVLENARFGEDGAMSLKGFHADTMHMARLFDTSRGKGSASVGGDEGSTGYSLESLSTDRDIFRSWKEGGRDPEVLGKRGEPEGVDRERAEALLNAAFAKRRNMKEIFGQKKILKNGTEGKTVEIAAMEKLQESECSRGKWIAYSGTDAKATWMLFRALKENLNLVAVKADKTLYPTAPEGKRRLWDAYVDFIRPFGELLTDLEYVGVWVDREVLKESEARAREEEAAGIREFIDWASKYIPDAEYLNASSVPQLRQLFYGGLTSDKDKSNVLVPEVREFKAENIHGVIEPGAKRAKKYITFELPALKKGVQMPVYSSTATGMPQLNAAVLRNLAGKPGAAAAYLDALRQGSAPDGRPDGVGDAFDAFGGGEKGAEACVAIDRLVGSSAISTQVGTFLQPLQKETHDDRIHCSLNLNTETGRLSSRKPNMQNLPALEKDLYGVRRAISAPDGKAFVVADYGQLELRLLAHLASCASMLDAFEKGGDFHSRTALGMYDHIKEKVAKGEALLDYSALDDSIPEAERPPLIKDIFASERRKAKVLNFSIAYGKTEYGLAKDFGVSLEDAKDTLERWYADRPEVRAWQEEQRRMAKEQGFVATMLGRRRNLPDAQRASKAASGRARYDKAAAHALRAAINSPIQGSAADVAMCAMIRIQHDELLKELGWTLLLQVHDEVILEGPQETAPAALARTKLLMESPFDGLVEAARPTLAVALAVDANTARTWIDAK